jgi:flagellar hook-length control protein FliK
MQALAQSQADAEDSVDATAAAAPQEVTGNKSKAKSEDDSDSSSTASLSFLPQSLVAAMAGAQQPVTQGAILAGNANSDSNSDSEPDSTDGVSLASGSSVQDIVANLTKGTVEELKDVTEASGDAKTNAPSTTTAADASASAVSAFQAHMSAGSHIQQTTSTDPGSNKVSSTVGTEAFDDELGGKITWMANQGVQSASLQLSPEHLGPVEVRISVQDSSATVAFNANHADTRAALEQALPRLREMLASQGLSLTDASVSQQSPRGQAQKQSVAAVGSVNNAGDDSTSSVTSVASARLGLLDTYA